MSKCGPQGFHIDRCTCIDKLGFIAQNCPALGTLRVECSDFLPARPTKGKVQRVFPSWITFDQRPGIGLQLCGERVARRGRRQRQDLHRGRQPVHRVRRSHHHDVSRRYATLQAGRVYRQSLSTPPTGRRLVRPTRATRQAQIATDTACWNGELVCIYLLSHIVTSQMLQMVTLECSGTCPWIKHCKLFYWIQ